MSFLKKIRILGAASFLTDNGDILTLHPTKFVNFMKDYGIAVDPSDIRQEKSDEILLSFDSFSYDGSVPPSTLNSLEAHLEGIDHIDFVYINTAKYQMRLEFDKDIEYG
jgi:hypothetical protein